MSRDLVGQTLKTEYELLVVLPCDGLGGAERVTRNLVIYVAQNLDRRVLVCFLAKGNRNNWGNILLHPNVDIYYGKAKTEKLGVFGLLVFLFSRRVKSRIVWTTHLHMNALVSLLRSFRLLSSAHHIARESTVIFDRFFGWKRVLFYILYSLYNRVDILVCQSSYMKEQLLRRCGWLARVKVLVLRNPLNLADIDSELSKVRGGPREHLQLLEVVHVGRLSSVKNIPCLLGALSLLSDRGHKFRLVFVGDGDQRAALEVLVNDLGLQDDVIFVGETRNPYVFMRGADVGVLVSEKEGFPNVLLEMMASGTKYIVTTPCAGDLNKLPGVKVVSEASSLAVAQALEEAAIGVYDRREIYRRYAQSIDIEHFWVNLQAELDEGECL